MSKSEKMTVKDLAGIIARTVATKENLERFATKDEFASLQVEMDMRFNVVDNRFERLDDRLSALEDKIRL